jgi:hypothetical protein
MASDGGAQNRNHMGSGATLKKILYAIFRGKITKQIIGSYVKFQEVKK